MNSSECFIQSVEEIINSTQARISITVEIDEQKIIEKDSDREYLSASLIKIPIMMEAYRQSELGTICLTDLIEIKDFQKVGGSGVLHSLTGGTQLSIKDLLTLMIIVSDNTATNIMIELLGKDNINQFCRDIGAHHTKVERKLMDVQAKAKGYENITTASDMICLLKELDQNEFLSKNSTLDIQKCLSAQQFRHKLPGLMDQDLMKIANKTGEMEGIEHDVAIIHYGRKKAYIAVLIDQLEQNFLGQVSIAKIGESVYEYLLKQK